MAAMTRHHLARLAVLALAGCRADAPSDGVAGAERGPCKRGRACDDGLTCLSDLCVRPPPADCAAVGKQLSFRFLDNYTPRAQRDAFVAEVGRQCETGRLSERDGACLVRARNRAELRACPRPIGIGDCAKLESHFATLPTGNDVDAYLVTDADRALARCKTEAPSLAFEQCALAARALDEVARCTW